MKEVVVDVIRPQALQRVLEHLLALVEWILLRREVREFRRDKIVAARIAAPRKGLAHASFRFAPAVRRGCVEVVDTVVEQILDLFVQHLLVDAGAGVAGLYPVVRVSAVNRRQAHRAVAEQRHFLAARVFAKRHGAVCSVAVR